MKIAKSPTLAFAEILFISIIPNIVNTANTIDIPKESKTPIYGCIISPVFMFLRKIIDKVSIIY